MADLTTTAKVKAYMRKTDATDDTLLGVLVTAVSDRIEKLCGRVFGAADYTEWFSGNGQSALHLKHYPVIYVHDVASGAANALSVAASGFIRATMQVYNGGVYLREVATSGAASTASFAFSSYDASSEVATQINARSGWTATSIQNIPADMLNPVAGIDVTSTTEYLTYPDDSVAFTVDRDTGILHLSQQSDWPGDASRGRLKRGAKNYFVRYNAGYATIPTDLEMLANELTAELFQQAAHDKNLTAESLGDYSYSLADAMQLDAAQRARLARYIDVPVGGAR